MSLSKIWEIYRNRFHLMSWQDYQILRFRQARSHLYKENNRGTDFPYQPGLVSVFLTTQQTETGYPAMLPSLSSQTYQSIEIITQEKANRNSYLTVKGEFLTWIEPDCLLEPDYFQKMVYALQQNPHLDLVTIDNKRNDKFNASPFLIRSKMAWVMGEIQAFDSPFNCSSYWHQANLVLNIKTMNLSDPDVSNSSKRFTELETHCPEQFQVQADFSRDFFLSPWVCFIQADLLSSRSARLLKQLKSSITQSGNTLAEAEDHKYQSFPRLWIPTVYILVTENPEKAAPLTSGIPENSLKVLLNLSQIELPNKINDEWDICFCLGEDFQEPVLLEKPWQGWIAIRDVKTLINVLDVRVHSHHYRKIETIVKHPEPVNLKISVVISTYHRGKALRDALHSVIHQTFPLENYEVIVVNNDPSDENICKVVDEIRNKKLGEWPGHIRLIQCPLTGLSYARNAGISETVGEIICFLDDDAAACDTWLEQIWQAFSNHSQLGVLGGHTHLKFPEPRPKVLKEGRERFWGQLHTNHEGYTEVNNSKEFPWGLNWCARRQALLEMGGFRGLYGRRKRDFSGGEELVAACLAQKLGYAVALLPTAKVDHHPDPSRFTYRYLMNTILSGIITQYRMKRDLYLPRLTATGNTPRGSSRFRSSLPKIQRLPSKVREFLTLEYIFYLLARIYLLNEQIKDTWARFWYRNEPVAGKEDT